MPNYIPTCPEAEAQIIGRVLRQFICGILFVLPGQISRHISCLLQAGGHAAAWLSIFSPGGGQTKLKEGYES